MTGGGLCSSGPLMDGYDAALVDLDGVVYLADQPVSGAAEAVAAARKAGMRLAFVTNNASRPPGVVAGHLRRFGIEAAAADVVTAAQATASLLAERLAPGAPVLVCGAEGLRVAVVERGMTVVEAAGDHPAAVVSGYDDQLTYARLAEACLAVRAGAWWVAANVDRTLPTLRGSLPGNGALVALVAAATGARPVVAGKPEPPLFREAVRRTGGQTPLVVGDRLDTDIAGARLAGIDALLVLTGVSGPRELVDAPPAARPTYLAADLAGLLEPQPAVDVDGNTSRCRSARAVLDGGRLRMSGDGQLDRLRAGAALAWAAADGGAQPPTELVGLDRPAD